MGRVRTVAVWVGFPALGGLGLLAYLALRPPVEAREPAAVRFALEERAHLDHSHYFTAAFASPQEVTRACLTCHPKAAAEMMATPHWQWLGDEVAVPGHPGKTRIGKKNLLNNFCITVTGNLASCTECHAGYGWADSRTADATASPRPPCTGRCRTWSPPRSRRSAATPATVLDTAGRPVVRSGATASAERTCGGCHDADYIGAHNGHWNERVHATCVDCHVEKGDWPPPAASLDSEGRVRRDALRVSSPRNENCAGCHQVAHSGSDPLWIPDDFETSAAVRDARAFTRNTGTVFSGQAPAESYLNLRDKARQTQPWDVHAQRLVRCVDCHDAPNNPTRGDLRRAPLDFVVRDPRRIDLAEFSIGPITAWPPPTAVPATIHSERTRFCRTASAISRCSIAAPVTSGSST